MSRKKKIAIAAGVLLVLYTLIGFLVIPKVAESVLPNKLTEYLQRPASVENVSFNPYTLTLSVEGMKVQDKKDESKNFIAVEELFANQTGQKADLDFSANLPSDGTWSMTGSFGISPSRCNVEINVADLDLKQAQPYLPDSVHAKISDGRVHISGNARYQAQSEDSINAEYKGDVRVSDLAVSEEQDGQDLTTLQSFAVKGINASWNPARVDIQQISVSDLQQRLALEKDGQLNISAIFKKEPAEPRPQEKTEESAGQDKADTSGEHGRLPIPVSVGEIELSDLGLSFTDHTITPTTYSSEFTLTKGSITGLSTADAGTELFLKGAIDKHAAVTIEGTAAPLDKDIMFDIIAKLENLELSSLSPYARKFIGRNIEKGKLNLDIDCVVKDKQLEAENYVLLDEFSLGQQVEGGGLLISRWGLLFRCSKVGTGKLN